MAPENRWSFPTAQAGKVGAAGAAEVQSINRSMSDRGKTPSNRYLSHEESQAIVPIRRFFSDLERVHQSTIQHPGCPGDPQFYSSQDTHVLDAPGTWTLQSRCFLVTISVPFSTTWRVLVWDSCLGFFNRNTQPPGDLHPTANPPDPGLAASVAAPVAPAARPPGPVGSAYAPRATRSARSLRFGLAPDGKSHRWGPVSGESHSFH